MTDSAQPLVPLLDGTTIPQLGLGVWLTPADATARVVRQALEAGYTAVDTAAAYQNEEGVGEALAARPDVYVTTKLWNSDHGFDATLRAFDASARRLRRDVVDLYLIHWPAPRAGRFVESWKAMIRLKQEGRVRCIGVSNFRAEDLNRLISETGETPVLNQIELHPRFQQRALRAVHEKYGMRTESWSPLGHGGEILSDPALRRIGEKYGKTAAQVVIRWHIDSGLIVIPKTVNPARLRENIDVFDFALAPEDMTAIAALDSAAGRIGPDPSTANF